MPSTLKAIYTSPTKGQAIASNPSAELHVDCGIAGDRYYDSAARGLIDQVTLIDEQTIDEFSAEVGRKFAYADMRRNLLTSGVALNNLIGKSFRIGAVLLHGTELADPCAGLVRSLGRDDVEARSFFKRLKGNTGIRARIVEGGTIQVGDRIEVA